MEPRLLKVSEGLVLHCPHEGSPPCVSAPWGWKARSVGTRRFRFMKMRLLLIRHWRLHRKVKHAQAPARISPYGYSSYWIVRIDCPRRAYERMRVPCLRLHERKVHRVRSSA